MKRLLVVRLSALGDVIHAIPAVVALRDHFDVEWVVEAPYRDLVEIIARVRALPVSLKRFSFANIAAARRAVRGPDVAVDFQGLVKSALLARASGARERYGFAPPYIREKPAAWLMNRHVAIDPSRHVIEWNLELARALAPALQMPAVDFSPFALGASAPGRVVLVPGAGKLEKQWPVARFRELAQRIGADSLVVWGPGEKSLAEAIGAEMAPPTNLRELAAILRSARIVVGADTGPLHLAAALGTPVIGLYGPTNPARNGPFGQLDACISTYFSTRRMETIETSQVLTALKIKPH